MIPQLILQLPFYPSEDIPVNKDFVLQAKWDFLEKSDQLIESINAFKKQKTGFSIYFVSKYNKIVSKNRNKNRISR
jgi:hypothetical protein